MRSAVLYFERRCVRIEHRAKEDGITVEELFEEMYKGYCPVFDLTLGGERKIFKTNDFLEIRTLKAKEKTPGEKLLEIQTKGIFDRKVNTREEVIIEHEGVKYFYNKNETQKPLKSEIENYIKDGKLKIFDGCSLSPNFF